jgi:hypothetical protein
MWRRFRLPFGVACLLSMVGSVVYAQSVDFYTGFDDNTI